jgi:hypothetical protein
MTSGFHLIWSVGATAWLIKGGIASRCRTPIGPGIGSAQRQMTLLTSGSWWPVGRRAWNWPIVTALNPPLRSTLPPARPSSQGACRTSRAASAATCQASSRVAPGSAFRPLSVRPLIKTACRRSGCRPDESSRATAAGSGFNPVCKRSVHRCRESQHVLLGVVGGRCHYGDATVRRARKCQPGRVLP